MFVFRSNSICRIAYVCLSGPHLDDDICVIELDLRYYSVKLR